MMRVPLVGAGTEADPRRPDLPEYVSYTFIEDHNDGTVTVEVDPSYQAPALALAARLAIVDKVRADALDDATVAALTAIFPPWIPGITAAIGEVYSWDGTLVECIQAHTNSDPNHTPNITPALWKIHRTPDMTEWTPGILVLVDEEFTYEGLTYRVVQEHTTQSGWEPPNAPALWTLV